MRSSLSTSGDFLYLTSPLRWLLLINVGTEVSPMAEKKVWTRAARQIIYLFAIPRAKRTIAIFHFGRSPHPSICVLLFSHKSACAPCQFRYSHIIYIFALRSKKLSPPAPPRHVRESDMLKTIVKFVISSCCRWHW